MSQFREPPDPEGLEPEQLRKFQSVKAILDIRATYPALSRGNVSIISTTNQQLILLREHLGSYALLLFNNGPEPLQHLASYSFQPAACQSILSTDFPIDFKCALSFSNGLIQDPSQQSQVRWSDGAFSISGAFTPCSVSVYVTVPAE